MLWSKRCCWLLQGNHGCSGTAPLLSWQAPLLQCSVQDWLQLWQVQAPLLETALTQRLLAHHLRVPLQVLKCWQYQVEVLLHCQLGLSQGQLHWPRQLPHQSWKEQGLVHWSLGMLQLSLGPGQEQCWDWLLGLGLVHSQQELVLELLQQATSL